jgi:colanic acid biosynthesis glycosyl transferase WcaI
MRILINSINFAPELTSTGKYTGEMAQWLAERGHEVRAVTSPPHYPHWCISEGYSWWRFKREKSNGSVKSSRGVDVFRCPLWIPRVPRGWRRMLYYATFALSSWPVMLAQTFWRPDIVLSIEPTLFSSPHSLCVARLCSAAAWLHVQDLEVDVAFELRDLRLGKLQQSILMIERFLLRRFDMVSAISDRMVERLSSKGVDASRTVLFPNWVDTSEIYPLPTPNPLRRELGISDQTVVALYSGNMGLKQGLHLIIDASRQLAHRRDILFVMCGEGPCRNALVEMSAGAGNVVFLPLQPIGRLNELLNMADIHLLPQLAGAADLVMPSKLTGMMASGKAILATADEGTQLARVLAGRGACARPGDVTVFAMAIASLADNPELRRQMGVEARKYAVTHLNRDDILSSFESSLMKACGHTPLPVQQRPFESPSGHRPILAELTRPTAGPDECKPEPVVFPHEL